MSPVTAAREAIYRRVSVGIENPTSKGIALSRTGSARLGSCVSVGELLRVDW